MAKSKTIQKSSNVISRLNEDGSYSVLRLDDYDNYYQVDGVTGELWGLIDGKRDEAQLIKLLSQKYPDFAKEMSARVKKMIGEFKKSGFLE